MPRKTSLPGEGKLHHLFERAKAATRSRPAAASGIPSQAQYEENERWAAIQHERHLDKLPLSERKDNAREFFDGLQNPALIVERISWLVDGNYGYGPMQIAKALIANRRMNRVAGLTQMIGVFEWMTPRAMAVRMWYKLTPAQQAALDRAVTTYITKAESEGNE